MPLLTAARAFGLGRRWVSDTVPVTLLKLTKNKTFNIQEALSQILVLIVKSGIRILCIKLTSKLKSLDEKLKQQYFLHGP